MILAWVLCIVLREKGIGSETKRIFAGALVLIAFWQGVTYMSQLMNEEGAVYFIRTGSVGTMNGENNEYLLSEGDNNDIIGYVKYIDENADRLIYDAGVVEVFDQSREDGIFYMTVFNQTDQTQEIVLPILKYKGYRAFSQSGEELHLAKGERNRISVFLPPFFEGTVQVEFREPWYWRLSEWISLFTFLSLLGYSRGKKLCGKLWEKRNIGE